MYNNIEKYFFIGKLPNTHLAWKVTIYKIGIWVLPHKHTRNTAISQIIKCVARIFLCDFLLYCPR